MAWFFTSSLSPISSKELSHCIYRPVLQDHVVIVFRNHFHKNENQLVFPSKKKYGQ